MKNILLLAILSFFLSFSANSQPCTPQGDQSTYGTNDSWIGYAYNNLDLTSYAGFVQEGVAGNPGFDQSFGGDDVNYPTNGCPVTTSTFSVRYKLNKTFASGAYEFTVGGDDGYRLSLDGGATWPISNMNDHPYTSTQYTATLSGNVNMILEYYENGGQNRISFGVVATCTGTENQTIPGSANTWNGYVYDGTNFNVYKGLVQEGTTTNPAFDESFGGSNVSYATSGCSLQTETFSVRYRLTKTFTNGSYTFIVGGDDGYRLSVDGGSSWLIDKWNDQGYAVNSGTVALNGTVNLVLEYYENGGDNRISFNMLGNSLLPITLVDFSGIAQDKKATLSWEVSADSNPDYFEVEKSGNAQAFTSLGKLKADAVTTKYHYTDAMTIAKTFYRLKMTDLTGKITYSKIIELNSSAQANGVTLYPTVMTGTSLYLQSSGTLKQASVIITDAMGKLIGTKSLGRVERGQVISFAPGNGVMSKGIYLVQINDKNERIDTKRFIIQ